eukprot:498449-Pyramimonas_sp.AAC.1
MSLGCIGPDLQLSRPAPVGAEVSRPCAAHLASWWRWRATCSTLGCSGVSRVVVRRASRRSPALPWLAGRRAGIGPNE